MFVIQKNKCNTQQRWRHVIVLSKSHSGEETEGMSGENRWKMKRKLSEVNTRAVSRWQNDLIGEFKVAGVMQLVLGDRSSHDYKEFW